MQLSDQVCSLEYAKRLKELRVKQNAFWSYNDWSRINKWKIIFDCPESECEFRISAFTSAELGELLPAVRILNQPTLNKLFNNPYWEICSYIDNIEQIKTADGNLSNAMAKMLIHLIENGLMEVKNE